MLRIRENLHLTQSHRADLYMRPGYECNIGIPVASALW